MRIARAQTPRRGKVLTVGAPWFAHWLRKNAPDTRKGGDFQPSSVDRTIAIVGSRREQARAVAKDLEGKLEKIGLDPQSIRDRFRYQAGGEP